MQVMILDDDRARRAALRGALLAAGFGVSAFAAASPARQAARGAILDLLVMAERVGGRLAHDLALLAEWRNPGLGLVLLSDRRGEAREEIGDLLPSLRALLAADAGAESVLRATLAAAEGLAEGRPVLRWRTLGEAALEEEDPIRPGPPPRRLSPRQPGPPTAPDWSPPPARAVLPFRPPKRAGARLHLL